MTERQLEDRLRRWHLDEADASPMPLQLRTLIDDLVQAGSRPRAAPFERPLVVLVAVLLLLAAALVAVTLGSRILQPDLALDPAALDPCEVLPGPGLPTSGEPNRHAAPRLVGGDACAYGWDDGGNLHLQLRDDRTTRADAQAIAARLFSSVDGQAPVALLVDGHAAWLGRAAWSTATSGGDMMRPCAAMAVSAEPYFFVAWLTCREGLPAPTEIDWEGFQERLVAISGWVLANLDALNDGRPVPHRVDVEPGRGLGY